VSLDLSIPELDVAACDLGAIDSVSAGAITTSALYCIARMPSVDLLLRTFDDDRLDLSNLNRYPLGRRSQVGMQKTEALAAALRDRFPVTSIPARFNDDVDLASLRPRVLVGVDDIPARWTVQRRAPGWVGVGATSLCSSKRPACLSLRRSTPGLWACPDPAGYTQRD
jgi:hypothetical protein